MMAVQKVKFVDKLEDLIQPEEYENENSGKIRIRIKKTMSGVEILGDALNPQLLEKILNEISDETIEMTLCG